MSEDGDPIDTTQFAPGTLVDHGEGHYSLLYSSFPTFDGVFEHRGLDGGGDTWRAMVVHLLEEQAPEVLEAVDFDPDASVFCALSDSLPALKEVAKALERLQDRDTVLRLVEHVDLRQYD